MEISGVGEQYFKPEMVVRSKETVKADLVAMEKEFDKMTNETDDWWGKLSETDQDILDEAAENVFENNNLSDQEKEIEINKRILAHEDNPEIANLIKICADGFKLKDELIGLQNEYLPYKKQEVAGQINEIEAKADFGQVVNYYADKKSRNDSGNISNTFGEFYYLRKVSSLAQEEFKNNDYDVMIRIENQLKSYESEWREKGFIDDDKKDDRVVVDVEDIRKGRQTVIESINKVEEDIKNFSDISSPYKRDESYIFDFLFDLERSLSPNEAYGMDKFSELDYDPRLIMAAGEYVKKRQQENVVNGKVVLTEQEKKNFAESKIEDGKEDFTNLKFSGFSEKEGMELILDGAELKQYLKDNIPVGFFKGITEINASDEIPPEDVDLVDNKGATEDKEEIKVCTDGEFISVSDERGNYVSGNIKVYAPINLEKGSDVMQKVLARSRFNDVAVHEIGHGVHKNLTLEEYEAWEKILEEDKTAVTWYVDYARKKTTDSGKREDFSETFITFSKSPGLLEVLSEKRFEYMKELYLSRTEEDKREKFKSQIESSIKLENLVWEVNNLSKERIKEIYKV